MTRRMAAAISHRGPDDDGYLENSRVSLGVRRLSIVDIPGGHQPIASEDGAVHVVYNGETYNYLDLRRELITQGHRFTTSSDTEVIVHAYEQHGPHALARLNGIFALAIWDSRRQRLLLARDPLGVKPLYYTERNGTLAFASEVKALLTLPWVAREVDLESLRLYLSFRFVPSPRTLFLGIRKLKPGEFLLLEPGGSPRLETFSTPPKPMSSALSEGELLDEFRRRFRSAVHRQMMGDVPAGVLLSGGMDSAAILALAAEKSDRPVRAYTVGFEDAPNLDETELAAATARFFGAEHECVRVSSRVYQERFASSFYSLDEPVATPSVAPFDVLCQLASQGHKMVLSGQGADEPFGGYLRHRGEKIAGHPLGRFLAKPIAFASALMPRSEPLERALRTMRSSEPLSRYAETLALFPDSQVDRILLDGRPAPKPAEALQPLLRAADNLDSLARFLYLDARFGLADDLLLYTDKISMASSLEVRVPFLDLDLLQFVESIPSEMRVRILRPKRFLKSAFSSLLPPAILDRPKRNFSPPESAWLTSPNAGPGLASLLDPKAPVNRYLSVLEIQRIIEGHRAGQRDRRRQIFALLAFQQWHRTFIETPAPEGSWPRIAESARPLPSKPPAAPMPMVAAGDWKSVTHFGPGPNGPGGMSSVLRSYADLPLEGYRFRFVKTYHPDAPLHSFVPFLRASWQLATSPQVDLGIAHFHLSKGGSFAREGALLFFARWRHLPICLTIHSGAFLPFLDAHPRMVRAVLSRADRVLVLSAEVEKRLRSQLGITEVRILPNLVESVGLTRTPSQSLPRVVFGGDVCAEKGVDTLIECWPQVLEHVPGAELMIAGPSRGIAPKPIRGVRWLGLVPRTQVFELLDNCRVAVLPSRSEGMPLFVLEAMSMGRPVVATPVGTLPEILRGCGTLVPVGDSRQLAEALARYLLEPARADYEGTVGRGIIEKSYGLGETTRALGELYDSLRTSDNRATPAGQQTGTRV